MRALLLAVLFFPLALTPALAQSSSGALGLWKTIDDETGRARSIVRITERGGEIEGEIVRLIRQPDEVQDPVCSKCSGERKGQRITGMTILWGLSREGDTYEGGRILDPGKGKTYRAKLWVEDGALQVRGYIGPFHRTQTWLRATEADLQ